MPALARETLASGRSGAREEDAGEAHLVAVEDVVLGLVGDPRAGEAGGAGLARDEGEEPGEEVDGSLEDGEKEVGEEGISHEVE